MEPMRWIALLAVALAACTPTGTPSPAPTAAGASAAAVTPAASQPPAPQLPAVEPTRPTLQAFRARAEDACAAAARKVQAAPLRGDPLRDGATAADRRAAVAHYRAMAGAWTTVADDLFTFGMPAHKGGRKLVTALDTVAQYSQQTAEFLGGGDLPTSQAGVAAVDDAFAAADRIAARLGMPPVSQCGEDRLRLRNPTRVRVNAYDFGFEVGPVSSGPTRFVLHNSGTERHHLFVVRLRGAGTLGEAVRADRAGQDPGAFLLGQGNVSPVARPGERSTVDARLRSGSYGVLCFIASPDGTPHAYKGMAAEISVP